MRSIARAKVQEIDPLFYRDVDDNRLEAERRIRKLEISDPLKATILNPTFSDGITVTNDAKINGLTIGRGSGNNLYSTVVGYQAQLANTTGSQNSAFGYQALFSGTAANYSSAFGLQALYASSGNYNSAFGYGAGLDLTTGSGNTILGAQVQAGGGAVANNIIIGNGTGSVKARHNALGWTFTGLIAAGSVAPTIASAATIAPTTPIVFISGVIAIATITAPSPISATGGTIILIPTGLWTTTAAGNIALATTAVVSKALQLTYDATTAKWYPSY